MFAFKTIIFVSFIYMFVYAFCLFIYCFICIFFEKSPFRFLLLRLPSIRTVSSCFVCVFLHCMEPVVISNGTNSFTWHPNHVESELLSPTVSSLSHIVRNFDIRRKSWTVFFLLPKCNESFWHIGLEIFAAIDMRFIMHHE